MVASALAGLELPHDCKLGVCMTCPARVVSSSRPANKWDAVEAKTKGCLNDEELACG